jgi:prefoldin alpha subunit
MSGDEEQQKVMAYRLLEARGEAMMRQREAIMQKFAEIESTQSSMEELSKRDSEILFPIGGEAYAFGKVTDGKRYIVEIGAGMALEKTYEEAKTVLEKRKADMKKLLGDIDKEMENLSAQISGLMSGHDGHLHAPGEKHDH